MSSRDIVRRFDVHFNDGTMVTVESFSYPWTYREWFVVADLDDVKSYYPTTNVARFVELVDA